MRTRIHRLKHPPSVLAYAAAGGLEEGRGPFGRAFDHIDDSDTFGQSTWEKAEGEMARTALNLALAKAGLSPDALSLLVAGDLQNQCVASSGGLYSFGIPYLGLYGACSTCTESLAVLSLFLSEGVPSGRIGAAVTGSHNSAAERQFRLPLEYGGQRAPSAQWTATAAGAVLLTDRRGRVQITELCPGKIIDGTIGDATNMGAAMAPAAADTLRAYFRESGLCPDAVDAVFTGDLGAIGSELLHELLREDGLDIRAKHRDCGLLLYDGRVQDVHSGGSGCGCSAAILSTHVLPALESGELRDVLFLSTGALMSPTSVQQGEHIFGIAPLIRLRRTDAENECTATKEP